MVTDGEQYNVFDGTEVLVKDAELMQLDAIKRCAKSAVGKLSNGKIIVVVGEGSSVNDNVGYSDEEIGQVLLEFGTDRAVKTVQGSKTAIQYKDKLFVGDNEILQAGILYI